MTKSEMKDRWLWLAAALVLLGTFIADLLTPLGYAEWCLYFVAVGVTLYQSRPAAPLWVAGAATILVVIGSWLSPPGIDVFMSHVNRFIGIVGYWSMAWVVNRALYARHNEAELLWSEERQNALMLALRGERSPEMLARIALTALADALGAEVGALYQQEGAGFSLVGGLALDRDYPRTLAAGEGLLGEVARSGQPRRVAPVEGSHLKLASSLGDSVPGELLLAPVTADGEVIGAFELGRTIGRGVGAERALRLLRQCAETVGIALRDAQIRQRLIDLLEETRRQSAELQAQQEELRVNNEELEEQSRSLQQSQASLESQQAELEQTNVHLEERTHELEAQRRILLTTQAALQRNARELAMASRYKSEFLANMSHELRTPLNSALILAKLLADNKAGTLTDEQVRYAQAIQASNNDLLVLINDILDLSRIEAGHVELVAEPLDLPGILQRLRETFEPMAAQKSLSLSIEGEADIEAVGDAQRLQQILKNLLANAVKFTERGEVRLRVAASGTDRLAFAVSDSGVGIAEEQQQIIFEAFRQADGSTNRRYGGTGLGLSISRDLAQRMGGTLTVASRPGEGSCFTLEVPLRMAATVVSSGDGAVAHPPATEPPPLWQPPVAAAGRDAAGPGKKEPPAMSPFGLVPDDRDSRTRPDRLVLVVEDEQAFAAAMVEIAHELDFDCVVAANAEEALQLAATLMPCGILLDIGLPDASGLTVLEQLKRDPAIRHIPVHVVSAMDRAQLALEMGAVGYLRKPAAHDLLGSAIRGLEARAHRQQQRLLIVEDDAVLRESLVGLLARDGLEIVAVGTAAQAHSALADTPFDCVVTDLSLADGEGDALLEQIAQGRSASSPPVIVYTGRAMGWDEEQRLRRFSKSIIIKGARSPERLLDEVTLFLHSVESQLPSDQQRLLAEARRRDTTLDGQRILLAEDDIRNVFALSSLLEPLGVKLAIARNGREALEHLEREPVDLVLMDIMMPEMDGLEAMRAIRGQPRWDGLPIIALTANVMSDDRQRCLDAGANDYIAKPVDVDKLVSLCRVWCSRR